VEKKEKILKIKPHSDNVRHFSIYENKLISGSIDKHVVFLDVHSLKEKKRINISDSCKFLLNEDKHELMIGKYDGYVDLLNLKTNKSETILSKTKDKLSAVWSLIYFQENDSYFFGTENGNIIELKNEKVIKCVNIGMNRISEMLFYKDKLVVVSFDQHLRILDPFTLEILFSKKINWLRFTWILNVKNQYFISCGVSGSSFQVWKLKPNHLNVLKVLKRKRDLNFHFHFE
jgi:WD40 repeat protein